MDSAVQFTLWDGPGNSFLVRNISASAKEVCVEGGL